MSSPSRPASQAFTTSEKSRLRRSSRTTFHCAKLDRTARSLKRSGQHRKRVEAPALPGRVVGGGLVELDEVAEAPGDDVAVAAKGAAPPGGDAQRAGDVPRHAGFLCDDELHTRAIVVRRARGGVFLVDR